MCYINYRTDETREILRLWHLSDEGADKGIGTKQFKQISSLSKKLM